MCYCVWEKHCTRLHARRTSVMSIIFTSQELSQAVDDKTHSVKQEAARCVKMRKYLVVGLLWNVTMLIIIIRRRIRIRIRIRIMLPLSLRWPSDNNNNNN
jgi:hypothetical protein